MSDVFLYLAKQLCAYIVNDIKSYSYVLNI